MKTIKTKLAGQELKLAFTFEASEQIAEKFGGDGPIDGETLNGILSSTDGMLEALVILARCGAEIEGEKCDVDAGWLKKRLGPGSTKAIVDAILAAVTEGMRMETETGDEDEEVDVVLEELKKKEATDA